MASIAPSRPVEVGRDKSGPYVDSKNLSEALQPWRRRLWVQQTLRWTGNGMIAGIILACLLLLISRLIPWATASEWAIAVALASLLCAVSAASWYRPSFARTARRVDARLALHDRLSTAWELRDESAPPPSNAMSPAPQRSVGSTAFRSTYPPFPRSPRHTLPAPLVVLQRRDALKQLNKHTPSATLSLRPRRSRLILFGVVILSLALLVFLPNPQTAVLQQQAAFQARIAKQIAAINHIRTVIDSQTTTSPQEQAQIDKILREAAAQLQNAKNEAQAQQILAQAQAKLNQLRDPQAANKAQAHAAASAALQNSSNPNLSSAGQSLAKGDSKALQAALQKLASQINSMTAAQRAKLAQQIEQAANQAKQ